MRSPEHLERPRYHERQSMLDSAEALKTVGSEKCTVKGCDCRQFITSGINAVDVCRTCGHRDFDHDE